MCINCERYEASLSLPERIVKRIDGFLFNGRNLSICLLLMLVSIPAMAGYILYAGYQGKKEWQERDARYKANDYVPEFTSMKTKNVQMLYARYAELVEFVFSDAQPPPMGDGCSYNECHLEFVKDEFWMLAKFIEANGDIHGYTLVKGICPRPPFPVFTK